jgi:hypothetical protein
MSKVKFLLKVCELASVTLTVILRFLVVSITENTTANTDLGTLSATDADAGDTFTYTLENNSAAYFAIDGNTLKLAKSVDYETTKNLNITVRVTDANLVCELASVTLTVILRFLVVS